MANQIKGIFSSLVGAAQSIISGAASAFYAIGANIMVSLANGLISGAGAIAGAITGPLSGIMGLFRAEGGPVEGGSPYVVGERGPELFVPSSAGSITPNNRMPSGGSGGAPQGGDTWNVTVNASKDYPIDQIMADLERRQQAKRTQKGYRSTA
jgi:hypothetical protein